MTDPLVRIEAARLRDRLREYYEGEGQNDPVRIDLPKGTYTPRIRVSAPGALRKLLARRDLRRVKFPQLYRPWPFFRSMILAPTKILAIWVTG